MTGDPTVRDDDQLTGTARREYGPVEAVQDNHPKRVLTLAPMVDDNTVGIRHLRVPDFLLSDEY